MDEGRTRGAVAGVIYAVPPNHSHRFVVATDVESFVLLDKRSWVAEVGDVRVGVGVVHGRVVTLLRIGPSSEGPTLLCRTENGEAFLVEGGRVEETGCFVQDDSGSATWRGERIERLDVTALYRSVEKQLWERRWISREQLETKAPH